MSTNWFIFTRFRWSLHNKHHTGICSISRNQFAANFSRDVYKWQKLTKRPPCSYALCIDPLMNNIFAQYLCSVAPKSMFSRIEHYECVFTRHRIELRRISASTVGNGCIKSAYKKYEIMIISGALIVSMIKHVLYLRDSFATNTMEVLIKCTRMRQVGYWLKSVVATCDYLSLRALLDTFSIDSIDRRGYIMGTIS